MTIEFWFEFASTYSYPAAMRIEQLAKEAGAPLTWKPFLLGPIFNQQGWNDSPFNLYPVKGHYMWRDLARICTEQDVALHRPSRFPRNGLTAARVAYANAAAPWIGDFVRSIYRANFAEDREIGDAAVIAQLLTDLGQDADSLLAAAQTPDAKDALRLQTQAAIRHGIFGAPTVRVGDEIFWGNDRLEQALRWWREAH